MKSLSIALAIVVGFTGGIAASRARKEAVKPAPGLPTAPEPSYCNCPKVAATPGPDALVPVLDEQ